GKFSIKTNPDGSQPSSDMTIQEGDKPNKAKVQGLWSGSKDEKGSSNQQSDGLQLESGSEPNKVATSDGIGGQTSLDNQQGDSSQSSEPQPGSDNNPNKGVTSDSKGLTSQGSKQSNKDQGKIFTKIGLRH